MPPETESALLKWLQETDAWKLTQTEFYEQFEFSLFDVDAPGSLACLLDEGATAQIASRLEDAFDVKGLELVGITAHRLEDGHRIGVHNDFIDGAETHRFIIQVSDGWQEANGGYLMLFASDRVEDAARIIRPLSNTAFAFEISQQSHHAVSTIYDFERYSLVYTFKAKSA